MGNTNSDVNWSAEATGPDGAGNILTVRKCNNWVNNDPKSCKDSKTKPNVTKWIKCGMGSSPGGHSPGDGATACSNLSKDSNDFPCVGGQNCFAVTKQVAQDVNWDQAVTGPDGAGNILTIQKCNNWVNNDPKSCLNSATKPDTKKWIKCAAGSSPGGHAPGDGATGCSNLSNDSNDFPCIAGFNCFAVTKQVPQDVNWDQAVTGPDNGGNILTIQKCNNWVNNDPKSCLNSATKPAGTMKWIKCAAGSSPGGHAPGDGATGCSNLSKDSNDFPCIAGFNCFAVTKQVPQDVVWGDQISGKDGNGSKITIQKCNNWVNNDPKSCFNSATKPKFTHWISCGIGSSPGGIAPGDGATLCDTISKSEAEGDFTCALGKNCFGVNSIDVNWDAPVSGCDGAGNNLTIQKCNNWISNDPKSCLNSDTKPAGTIKWANCGIGSSPGGIAPGDKATVCSPLSSGSTDFGCLAGQNCFAVTKETTDASCNNVLQNAQIAVSAASGKIAMGIFAFVVFIILVFLMVIK